MSRILLIEDDHWLASSYQRLLEREGHKVTAVTSAEEAMQKIEKKPPQLIIADVMLEGHTVFSLLHELQSYDDTSLIPVVLCSNLESAVLEKAKFPYYGIRKIFNKTTVEPTQLVEVVQECSE